MATRAKFVVTNKEDTIASGSTVKLSAVTSGSAENEDFYKYTPSGQITLSTINEKAASEFKVGSFYYVDFTEVPE